VASLEQLHVSVVDALVATGMLRAQLSDALVGNKRGQDLKPTTSEFTTMYNAGSQSYDF
jgi:hypothetical protein